MKITLIIGAALICACAAQNQKYTTPVPILKQINKHNEDGSYSYGYEGADGSFKIESKYPNGEVYGKYGYVDDNGQLREVEYGATRRGFEPAGNDINVPPPTLPSQSQQNQYAAPLAQGQEDDGQYREDPSVYYKDSSYNSAPVSKYQTPVSRYQPAQPAQQAQPVYQEPQYQEPAYEAPQQYYRPQQNYNRDTFLNSDFFRAFNNPTRYTQPAPRYDPPQQRYTAPAPRYNPVPSNYNNGFNNFGGHPAQNLDINTGSYSVNY